MSSQDDVLARFGKCSIVCFDVDSTVIKEEGINVLAEYCGAGSKVAEYTAHAMNGNMPFEQALAERLAIIKPSISQIDACIQSHPFELTEGVAELISELSERGTEVYLISGGFRIMIEPVCKTLGISKDHLFANTLLFDEDGKYVSFDSSEPTSRSGGKAVAINQILSTSLSLKKVCMIGDGMTDAEAKPPADIFIGYGGVVERASIRNLSDLYITDFSILRKYLANKR
jgi:phosphoserine phosphatase